MDTQHLKAFLTVARCGSFTSAAQQLYLTQPAISKRIAALEEQLDCRLFDRFGRNVTLTEAGRALLPRAQQILSSVRDAEHAISNLSLQVSGTLQLATSHHIGLHHLPSVLRQFLQHYPNVKPEILFLDSEKAYQAVRQGEVEVALLTLAPDHPSKSFADIGTAAAWEDPLSFVAAADHPLTGKARTTLADLSRHPAILPDLTTYTTATVKELFDQEQLPLEIGMATNYLETIKMMVSIGLGWGVLPDTMVSSELKILDVPSVSISRHLGCIYPLNRTLSNAAQQFIQLLRDENPASQQPD